MKKIVKQEQVYHGKVVDLIVYTVEHSDGRQSIREVIHHPHGVVAVAQLPNNKIIFVRQYRYAAKQPLLELPAGKVDLNELPEECAVRELEEETGYRATKVQKLCHFYPTPGFCDEILHVYRATDLVPTRQALDLGEESLKVEMYTLTEALSLIQTGLILDGKSIIGLLWLKSNL